MKLSPRELEYYESHNIRMFETIKDKYGNDTDESEDIIEINFYKKYKFLNIFNREKIWTKKYSFKRKATVPDENSLITYTMSYSCIELKDQLENLDYFIPISKENYNFFLDKYPERFL